MGLLLAGVSFERGFVFLSRARSFLIFSSDMCNSVFPVGISSSEQKCCVISKWKLGAGSDIFPAAGVLDPLLKRIVNGHVYNFSRRVNTLYFLCGLTACVLSLPARACSST